jgi:hypothetical protein
VPENPHNFRKFAIRHERAALKGEEKMKGQWLFPKASNVTEDFQEEAIHKRWPSIAPNWPREFPPG